MEAGASDKDKVEAPNGTMEMCSISFSIAQTSAKGKHHSNICAVRFLDSYGIIKMYSHFSAVHYVWCKDVKGATLPWVGFYDCCQA